MAPICLPCKFTATTTISLFESAYDASKVLNTNDFEGWKDDERMMPLNEMPAKSFHAICESWIHEINIHYRVKANVSHALALIQVLVSSRTHFMPYRLPKHSLQITFLKAHTLFSRCRHFISKATKPSRHSRAIFDWHGRRRKIRRFRHIEDAYSRIAGTVIIARRWIFLMPMGFIGASRFYFSTGKLRRGRAALLLDCFHLCFTLASEIL